MPWKEVFDHVELIFRTRADDMDWQTAVATFPHTDKKGRRQIQKTISEYRNFEIRPGPQSRKARSYDSLPADTRIKMIGEMIAHNGLEWVTARRRYQVRWLDNEGVSPDEAVSRYNAWASRVDDPSLWKTGMNVTSSGELVDG